MDDCPKLFPNWIDVGHQALIRTKLYSNQRWVKPPDYGGVGLDLSVDAGGLKYENPKWNSTRLMNLAAESCSLPFMPLDLTNNFKPCTALEKKENFKRFCSKLTHVRNGIKQKDNLAHRLREYKNCISDIRKSENYSSTNTMLVYHSLKYLVDHIPEHVVIPNFNVNYIGGNLDVVKTDDFYLLHPSSQDHNKLCVTPFQHSESTQFKPLLSEQTCYSYKNDPILQIDSSNHECCVVRSKSNYYLLNLNTSELVGRKAKKYQLSYLASSPYNPVEVLLVFEKGQIKLQNIELKENIWNANTDHLLDPSLLCAIWRCDFGSQPFSALCMNEQHLYSFDLREDGEPKDLFYIKGDSFHVNEELTVTRRWNRNPFQHFLASTDHFMICDERYPKKSVLIWNHSLKDSPVYCKVADFDNCSKSAVVLAAQESQRACAFFIEQSGTDVTPVSLAPPLLLSSPLDCVNSLRLHAHPVNSRLTKQLAYPITGISAVPHQGRTGFTVFEMASSGNLFFQDFKEKFSEPPERTYRVATGCTLTPPEKILPLLENSLVEDDLEESPAKNTDDSIFIDINIYEILNLPKEISSNCSVCRLNVGDNKLVMNKQCPGCDLDASESSSFSNAFTNLSALVGPASTEISPLLKPDVEYLSQFTDVYSKRMLKVWIDDDENTEIDKSLNSGQTDMEVDHGSFLPSCDISSMTHRNSSFPSKNGSFLADSLDLTDSFSYAMEMISQDFDFVPPSQEVRPLVGETLSRPSKAKKNLQGKRKLLSKAGF